MTFGGVGEDKGRADLLAGGGGGGGGIESYPSSLPRLLDPKLSLKLDLLSEAAEIRSRIFLDGAEDDSDIGRLLIGAGSRRG